MASPVAGVLVNVHSLPCSVQLNDRRGGHCAAAVIAQPVSHRHRPQKYVRTRHLLTSSSILQQDGHVRMELLHLVHLWDNNAFYTANSSHPSFLFVRFSS